METVDALTLTNLSGVIPVLQSKAIGEFTINLISLEIWENGASVNLALTYPSIRNIGRGRSPRLDVFVDDDGQKMRMRTGHGGGSRRGIDGHRFEYRSELIPLGQSLRLTVKLAIGEFTIPWPKEKSDGGWFGYSPAELEHEWTDIGAYSFEVALPENLISPSSLIEIERPALRHQFERRGPIDTDSPTRVVPIVQSREANDWLLTLIALETSREGMLLTSRVRGPLDPNQAMPTLRLAVRDDRGNQYAVWPSAGGGDAANGDRLQFRWSTSIEPVLDPNARALFIDAVPDFDTRDTCMLPGVIPDGEAMFEFVVMLE